jgi:hypothetical protein
MSGHRHLSVAFVLALCVAACSKGQTPQDCGDAGPDATCGPYTVLPALDGTVDALEGDGGDDSSDAEGSDVLEVSEGGSDGAADQAAEAAPPAADASDDGHGDDARADGAAESHTGDSGNDSGG